MADKREKLTVELGADLRERLDQWAAEEGRPLANLLRRIAAQQVERHERKRARSASAVVAG
jgi:hypothetical protein